MSEDLIASAGRPRRARRTPSAGKALAAARLAAAVAVAATGIAKASNLDTIGLTELLAIQPSLTGAGVSVAQAEADTGGANTFEVNPAAVGQPTNTFTYISDSDAVSNTFTPSDESSHADTVGGYFYGTNGQGVAPGVSHVYNISAGAFIGYDVNVDPPQLIDGVNVSVVNQSFIADESNGAPLIAEDQESYDTIYDNYIDTYGTIIVSAVGNGPPFPTPNAPSTSYNGIAVGAAYISSPTVGPTIDNGRSKPDITAPGNFTSYTTPLVSGSAAILVQAGAAGDGGSSAQTETDAIDVRTVKALLLNGANKQDPSVTFAATPIAPLDPTYGAGMLNVYNSYEDLIGGMQSPDSISNTSGLTAPHPPTSGAPLNSSGWYFGTLTTSSSANQYANYVFEPTGSNGYSMTATLVWNRPLNSDPSVPIGINNLDLFLYDVTSGRLLDWSTSSVDNVQDIYDTNLVTGDVYDLEVFKNGGTAGVTSGVVSNTETYALAFTNTTGQSTAIARAGVWNGVGSGSWSAPGNWYNSVTPQNAMDTANFADAVTGPATITLDGNRTLGDLNFLSTNSYTLTPGSGGTLTFANGANFAHIVDSQGNHTIAAPMILTSTTTATVVNAANSLAFTGAIGGGGALTIAGSGTVLLANANNYAGGTNFASGTAAVASDAAIDNGNNLAFQGGTLQFNNYASTLAFASVANLSLGAAAGTPSSLSGNITGTLGLTYVGPGTLTLSGANTYSGGTIFAAGTLAIGADQAIDNGNNLTFYGGTLQFNNYASTLSFPYLYSVSLGAATGGQSSLSGVISGNYGPTFVGPGTLALLGANTYSGTTTVAGGTLVVGAGGTLGKLGSITATVAAGALLAYDRGDNTATAVKISGNGGLAQWGTGTLTLTGKNTYHGTTTVSAGALLIPSTNVNGLPSGAVVVNNSALDLQAGTSASPQVLGKLTGIGALNVGLTGTAAYVQLAAGSGADTQSAVNVASGSTLDITNNKLVINYGSPGADPAAAIAADLKSGAAFGASGFNYNSWNGTGISSSTIAAVASSNYYNIGYLDGDNAGDNRYGDAAPNQILVEYTITGNAFLESSVGNRDLQIVAANFGTGTGMDWADGSFDYSGSVGNIDLQAVSAHYSDPTPQTEEAGDPTGILQLAWNSSPAVSAVPEPGSLALAAIGAAGLLARRRAATSRLKPPTVDEIASPT